MKELIKEFEQLELAMSKRLSSLVNESSLKAFVSLLEDYQAKVKKTAEKIEEDQKSIKEENDILRSISGVSDVDIRAKLIEAGEEARYLRKQLVDLKKSFDKSRHDNEALVFKIEEKKQDIQSARRQRENDAEKLEKELESVKAKLEKVKQEYKAKEEEIGKVNEVVKEKYLEFEKNTRSKVYSEVAALVNKMRDYCGVVASSAEFCLERWGGIKNKLSKESKGFNFSLLEGKKEKPLSEISADLELINQFSREAIKTLDLYLDLSGIVAPKLDKLSWQAFFDKLKRKYFDVLVKYKIKIAWPSEKKYPDFVTDENLLFEICDLVIQNSIESVSKDGEIIVKGEFSQERTVLTVQDNGAGVKKEDRDKIFLPFFSTKPGHKGVGLYRVFKLIEILGGSIKYEPKNNGSVFTIDIPGFRIIQENKL